VAITLGAERRNGQLVLRVGNEAKGRVGLKADLQRNQGEGVGLVNVARRLESFYGAGAGLSVVQGDGRFTVELRLPIELTL
jgi:LytS/YehU family sensor histidine kinase